MFRGEFLQTNEVENLTTRCLAAFDIIWGSYRNRGSGRALDDREAEFVYNDARLGMVYYLTALENAGEIKGEPTMEEGDEFLARVREQAEQTVGFTFLQSVHLEYELRVSPQKKAGLNTRAHQLGSWAMGYRPIPRHMREEVKRKLGEKGIGLDSDSRVERGRFI